jgi:hypothetical protein
MMRSADTGFGFRKGRSGRRGGELISWGKAQARLISWGNTPKESEIWVLYSSRRLLSSKIAAFVAYLDEVFPKVSPEELAAMRLTLPCRRRVKLGKTHSERDETTIAYMAMRASRFVFVWRKMEIRVRKGPDTPVTPDLRCRGRATRPETSNHEMSPRAKALKIPTTPIG